MIFPQLPHSSSVDEIHDSFSSSEPPSSSARARLTGSSSQKTHLRHLRGRSSRLSNVTLARRRDTRIGYLGHCLLAARAVGTGLFAVPRWGHSARRNCPVGMVADRENRRAEAGEPRRLVYRG